MLYLAGNTSLEYMRRLGIGVMLTPGKGGLPKLKGMLWAADNGCFARGAAFDLARFYRWLEHMTPARHTCLFAVAPDVVGDARATWERSQDALPEIARRGYLPAYVAQDGIENLNVEWSAFGCLFLGGTTRWKLSTSCADMAMEARRQGKLLHMGRVNSYARMAWADALGCHTVDGTFLCKAPDYNAPRLRRWMERLHRQPSLPFWAIENEQEVNA